MARYPWTSESVVEIHATSSVHPIDVETHDVRGEVSGELGGPEMMLDGDVSGYVEVPIDALKSGNKMEDFELRRRLDAKKYPVIRYELREAVGGPEQFKLRGALTFHGVTREFDEEITARRADGVLHVEGEHTFDIQDFDVKPPKILKLQVHPQVRIVARLVARRA